MPFKEWLFTNMTLRNMLTDFGFRNEATRSKEFTAYFAYRIGEYKKGDFWLYFPEQPFWEQYRNEIFNKLRDLDISSVPKYCQFHFELFQDHADFLVFVKNEAKERLLRVKKPLKRIKLEAVQDWVVQKEVELNPKSNEIGKNGLIQEIQQLLTEERKEPNPDFQRIVEEIKTLISARNVEYDEAQERLKDVLHALPSGRIELNNPQLENRLIEFFYHFSTLESPDKKAGAGLFKKFTQADLTSLLKTHFAAFKSLKYSTVQKNVHEIHQKINMKDPSLHKVNDALKDYFFR